MGDYGQMIKGARSEWGTHFLMDSMPQIQNEMIGTETVSSAVQRTGKDGWIL